MTFLMQCVAHKQSSRNTAGVTYCLLLNRTKTDLQFTQIFPLFIIYLFFDCAGFSLLRVGFLQLQRVGATLQLWCTGFSLQRFLLLQSTGSGHMGFSSCGTAAHQLWLMGPRMYRPLQLCVWAQQLQCMGPGAQAQELWCKGLVALRHVGSSWTWNRTYVSCIGRSILIHCTTREVPQIFSISSIQITPHLQDNNKQSLISFLKG